MKSYKLVALIAALLTPTLAIVDCSPGATHGTGPKVVKLLADDCVEIAQDKGVGALEVICATASELAPLLNLVMMRRQDAGVVDGAHEAGK